MTHAAGKTPFEPPPVTAFGKRYGDPTIAAPDLANQVLSTLLAHRSVRRYSDKALPTGTLETLLAAAQSAATSSNMQMWSVVTIDDPALRARLAAIASDQEHIRRAPLFLVWLADLSRAERIGNAKGTPLPGLDYLETFLVAVIDVALAAQNAVIAAESLGLGTVYIGAVRNDPEKVAEALGLPERVLPLFGLCVGHEETGIAHAASVKPRLPQSAVLHRDRYSSANESPDIALYDQRFASFQREQAMQPKGWTDRVTDRLSSVGALGGRDNLRRSLGTLGFRLE